VRSQDASSGSGGSTFDERAIRSQLRDLAAVLALPELWKGRDPPFVVEGLLEALVSLLRVEAARVRLDGPPGGRPMDVWCPRGPEPPAMDGAAGSAEGGGHHQAAEGPAAPALRVAVAQERVRGTGMRVVVASGRADFPTDAERFVLHATVEQAALAIEAAMVLERERAERAAAERARADAERARSELEAAHRALQEHAEALATLNRSLHELAAERDSLLASERAARSELETIDRLGQALAAELDLQRLVQAVTDAATEATRAQFGAFFYNVVDDAGERYTLYTISGVPRAAFSGYPLPRNTDLFGPTFRGEGVIRLDDVREDPRYGNNEPHRGMPPGHLPVVSYLAVPVVSRAGDVIGGLFFGHARRGMFTASDQRIVVALAAQAAVAMDNARLYQQAQQALRARDRFLATVSHDLRTPLTAIKGYAQVLRRAAARVADPVGGRLDEGLAHVESTAARMSGMINELLDVARLELGQTLELDLSRVDLTQLVRRAVAAQQVPTERLVVRVEAGAEELVGRWDAPRLERVVENLLSNAEKYSPDGGEIVVRLARQEDASGAWAVLAVEDHGIGVPAADLPHIFDRFYRAANASGRIAGSGLGLAGVRDIVERHGGRVTAESQEGKGSSLAVRLPLGASGGEQ
jgi:signal transduction histidine kinase